jgi:integrase
MTVAQQHPLECLIILAVTTGMRRGEILALRWKDIDFDGMTLKIRRSVSYIKVGNKNDHYESEPKTATSRRTITLPPFVVNALKQQRIRQREMRLKAGTKWQERNLVFCTKNGDFYGITTLQRQFRQLLAQAGLEPMRFHDLRHSAATILLSMDVNIKVIQELLGHSNVSTTLRVYSHVLPGMQRAAMNELDMHYKAMF